MERGGERGRKTCRSRIQTKDVTVKTTPETKLVFAYDLFFTDCVYMFFSNLLTVAFLQ